MTTKKEPSRKEVALDGYLFSLQVFRDDTTGHISKTTVQVKVLPEGKWTSLHTDIFWNGEPYEDH